MEPSSSTKINYKLKNDESFETDIKIYVYTEKSIVMTCSEHFGKSFAEQLKTFGKYNGNLKIGKGWIFANSKYANLQTLISDIISFKIMGEIPYEAKKSESIYDISGPLGQLYMENPIVTEFKKFISKLNDVKDKTVVNSNVLTYILGSVESVNATMEEMNKNESHIVNMVTTKTNKLVVMDF
jgi:hypothetical protein